MHAKLATWLWRSLGLIALLAWAVLWFTSLQNNRLVKARRTWAPAYQFLGVDFLHNYHASRHWLDGGDVYREQFGCPLGEVYAYPPAVLPLFSWCSFASPGLAYRLWFAALVLMTIGVTIFARLCRGELGSPPPPILPSCALLLCSTPVLFALERGNYDLLVLVLAALAAWALRSRHPLADAFAGGALAVAAWIKIYPAILLLGLLALRRWRVVGWLGVFFLAIGLADVEGTRMFVENIGACFPRMAPPAYGYVAKSVHTLSGCWSLLFTRTPLAPLGALPGSVGWALVFLPVIGYVCLRAYWCQSREKATFPLFLFLLAAGTFLPPISNDYNLIALPLAALILWDRQSPWWAHLAFAFLLLWWQPLALPIPARVLFAIKIAGVFACGGCLVRRLASRDVETKKVYELHKESVTWSNPMSWPSAAM